MVVLAVIIAVASYALAAVAGIWLVSRVRIVSPDGARGRRLFDWSIRAFIFLVMFLMVTWPVALLMQAVM